MAFVRFSHLLLLSRLVVGLLLFSVFMLSIHLIGQTWDVATGGPEVRLALDATTPNLFSAAHSAKAGWEAGGNEKFQRAEWGPLPVMQVSPAGFELAANPYAPLLRYREPNAWKRLTLFYLGASDGLYSLPWLILLSVGGWLVWRLLLDVTPETPFTLANARRLGQLALLVLGLNLVQEAGYVLVRALVPAFHAPGFAETLNHYVRLSTENTLPGYATGIMLAIIAIVYRRGVELSQEAELVI